MGEAWRSAWRRQPGLKLYADDNFHPSSLGSYVGALVICSVLGGRSALELSVDPPEGGSHATNPPEGGSHALKVAAIAATETVARFAQKPVVQEKK